MVPGENDVVADRIVGKPYIEYELDRAEIARYGVNIRDVQDVIETAVGGENLTMSVEGRERYPIRVRYLRELRDNFDELERVLVPTSTGAHVPIAQVAKIRYTIGPQELKSENGLLVGYVTMNTRDRDEVSVVEDAEVSVLSTSNIWPHSLKTRLVDIMIEPVGHWSRKQTAAMPCSTTLREVSRTVVQVSCLRTLALFRS